MVIRNLGIGDHTQDWQGRLVTIDAYLAHKGSKVIEQSSLTLAGSKGAEKECVRPELLCVMQKRKIDFIYSPSRGKERARAKERLPAWLQPPGSHIN